MRFIDRDITEEPESEVERKGNQTTRDLLIPSDRFKDFVNRIRSYFSRNEVISFAQELGIHPATVIGRLQYEKLQSAQSYKQGEIGVCWIY